MSWRKRRNWRSGSFLSHWVLRSGLFLASGSWGDRDSLPWWQEDLTLESEIPYPKYAMMSYRKESPISETIPVNNQTQSLTCLKWLFNGPHCSRDLCCVYVSHHCPQHSPPPPPASSGFTANKPVPPKLHVFAQVVASLRNSFGLHGPICHLKPVF